ncbi:7-carboxy-7-deazaguanine synthase QueE [bacterium]|nr:7-carboxy-7-deazaguanine synthase QueE [bacterium]
MQKSKANIKEIFSSIQGEGLYVGRKHLFIRFCGCNLNCKYCDTDFSNENSKFYSPFELFCKIQNEDSEFISLTGGEPLLHKDFLYEFLNNYKIGLKKKIYLETNGTLYNELSQIIDFVDIVAMDIKLESATGQENRFSDNEKFLEISHKKEVFLKIVVDNKINQTEIEKVVAIAKKYSTPIVLQPKMPIEPEVNLENIFQKFYSIYKNVLLIPQTHKFLNLQ